MRTKLKPLKNQVIVIAGASSGINLVAARKAAGRGARVLLISRNEEAMRAICEDIAAQGGEASYAVADVAVEPDLQRAAQIAVERYGGFDTWVNGAAVSIYGKVLEVTLEDQRRLFETNYWGVVNGSRIAAQHLRERGGAIVNVGSVLSDRAIPIQGVYSASKHAVKGFTDALRMEIETDRLPISVSLIKPSAIDTPYMRHAKNYLDVQPKNPPPVYSPDLVADAILYAAERRVRDIVVGGGGRLISTFGMLFPRLTDAGPPTAHGLRHPGMSSRILLALGLVALAAAVAARRRWAPRPARPVAPERKSEECAVSECGPDGVPLSLYAG